MCHAIADHPLGPYADLGVFIGDYPGNSGTIHGSVFEFQDRWWAMYHSGWVSGTQTARSPMIDELFYNSDGSIVPIVPRRAEPGDSPVGSRAMTVILDAAAAVGAGGKLHATEVLAGSGATGHGYVSGLVQQEYGVSVLFQVGEPRKYELSVRYRASAQLNARVIAGLHLFYDGNQNQSYDQYVNRGTVFADTQNEWVDLVIGQLDFASGDHQIRLSNSHNLASGETGIEVDHFKLVPLS
jgi:hypothetical protein